MNYSIQFISKPNDRPKRTWTLSQCSDMDKVQERLRRVRQLVTIITGSSSDILTELSDVKNILENCNPTWRRSIIIPEYRTYTLSISLPYRRAIITARKQGKLLHKIGLNNAVNMEFYQDVIGLMHILIRILEANNSPNIQWVNDMAEGRIDPYQDRDGVTDLQQALSLLAILQKPQHRSKIASHPPETNIYTSPSSYEIIITRH